MLRREIYGGQFVSGASVCLPAYSVVLHEEVDRVGCRQCIDSYSTQRVALLCVGPLAQPSFSLLITWPFLFFSDRVAFSSRCSHWMVICKTNVVRYVHFSPNTYQVVMFTHRVAVIFVVFVWNDVNTSFWKG